ncbi:hypothetical protein [Pseudoduganella violaceinigra]|uniref:hypothetical protein n=1 Tax=Pseudoduganella violaceinigra TaxID=246602 RepID=UPI00048096D7|nr:hypothetical protein [Pseudoduganella violaceinigra]
MLRWLVVALFIALFGCKPPTPETATAYIRISVAEAGASTPSKVLNELQRLGFQEQHNPAREPHFRIYSIRVPEEYLVGLPLQPGDWSSEQTLYFSGPKPFNDAGLTLYRKLVAGLSERIGERYVNPSSSSSTGQLLIPGALLPSPSSAMIFGAPVEG